jgi:ABC-type siderophore export system fused ATPase/permease subunit
MAKTKTLGQSLLITRIWIVVGVVATFFIHTNIYIYIYWFTRNENHWI